MKISKSNPKPSRHHRSSPNSKYFPLGVLSLLCGNLWELERGQVDPFFNQPLHIIVKFAYKIGQSKQYQYSEPPSIGVVLPKGSIPKNKMVFAFALMAREIPPPLKISRFFFGILP